MGGALKGSSLRDLQVWNAFWFQVIKASLVLPGET